MNEITFWSKHVRPALNSAHWDRVAWKVGTSTRAGIPDVLYRSRDKVAWLELKWLPTWPARITTPLTLGLSVEQRAHLREWCTGGYGAAFVVLLIEKDVLIFHGAVPNVLQQANLQTATLLRLSLGEVKGRLGRELDGLLFPLPGEAKEATWAPLP